MSATIPEHVAMIFEFSWTFAQVGAKLTKKKKLNLFFFFFFIDTHRARSVDMKLRKEKGDVEEAGKHSKVPGSASTNSSVKVRLELLLEHVFGKNYNKYKLLLGAPLVLWLVLFQLSTMVPESVRPEIDVETLPDFERAIFGSSFVHRMLPKNDFLIVMSAVPYIFHFAMPWIFALYLWRRDGNPLLFLWCLGLLNLAALLTQLVFPTAPPWYVEHSGTAVPTYATPSDPGRLARVDQILSWPLFQSMYGQNPIVFGSFPSLHGAWPFLIAIYTPTDILGNFKWLYVAWVWWAALYLKHHYLVDLLGGALYTLVPYYVSKLFLTQEFGISWEPSSPSFADLAGHHLRQQPTLIV
jgi:PAP2 superfamily